MEGGLPIKIELPDNYLNDEEKCGYIVRSETKKLWAVELDLLNELGRVCRENDLKYMVGAGTLLGAVRHHGFIPWDDDIDVYMLRGDYDRLISLTDEFSFPYFLQSAYSEKKLFRTHAQLRNSKTTGFIRSDKDRDINKGIFIDIFPIDGVSGDDALDKAQEQKNSFFSRIFRKYNLINTHSASEKLKKTAVMCFIKIYGKERLFRQFENNLSLYSKEGTEIWGNRTLVFSCPKSRRPYEDWKDLMVADFEFLKVPIQRNYDEILTQQYGDYMKIPEDKPKSHHGELTVSTDISYLDYCGE